MITPRLWRVASKVRRVLKRPRRGETLRGHRKLVPAVGTHGAAGACAAVWLRRDPRVPFDIATVRRARIPQGAWVLFLGVETTGFVSHHIPQLYVNAFVCKPKGCCVVRGAHAGIERVPALPWLSHDEPRILNRCGLVACE